MVNVSKNKPDFSIIIATYNRPQKLNECIFELCEQAKGNGHLEIVLVNDGGEHIPQGVRSSSSRNVTIKYFELKHSGPAVARNLCIKEAAGDILVFLDDDAIPEEDWLACLKRAWNDYPELDGIGGYTICGPQDSICSKANSHLFNWYLSESINGSGRYFLSSCNASYKKSSLLKIGGFDAEFKNASGEDRDLNIRLLRSGGRLRLDNRILVRHDKDLSFAEFVRKHFSYGRTAHKIYARHPGFEPMKIKSYFNLFKNIPEKDNGALNNSLLLSLLVICQLATMFGYLCGIKFKRAENGKTAVDKKA